MLKTLVFISILAGGGWFGLGKIETEMVYPFDPSHQSPFSVGLGNITERKIQTDGQTLIVWTHPARSGKPTILYFHGNAGNLANRAGRFHHFIDRGYGIVAPAYRGSSGSTGKPSEKALTKDARQIYLNLGKLISGLTAETVVIYGESLGTGVALKLAALPDTPQPAAVVLEAPYTSLPDVVLHLYPQMQPIVFRMKNIWHSLTHARSLTAPLLVLHGTEDRLIPLEMGRRVYAAAPSTSKQFIALASAGHNDVWRSDSMPMLWRFIDQVLR